MEINNYYNPSRNIFVRMHDHAVVALHKNIGDRSQAPKNILEKTGDAILWTTGLTCRFVRAIGKSFQDPRIVTVALTALALLTVSAAFYPSVTFAVAKGSCLLAGRLIAHIPFWAAKFSAYLLVCFTIIGAGCRAAGRFNNEKLMKAFYGLPSNFEGNPAHLSAKEIKEKQTASVLTRATNYA